MEKLSKAIREEKTFNEHVSLALGTTSPLTFGGNDWFCIHLIGVAPHCLQHRMFSYDAECEILTTGGARC